MFLFHTNHSDNCLAAAIKAARWLMNSMQNIFMWNKSVDKKNVSIYVANRWLKNKSRTKVTHSTSHTLQRTKVKFYLQSLAVLKANTQKTVNIWHWTMRYDRDYRWLNQQHARGRRTEIWNIENHKLRWIFSVCVKKIADSEEDVYIFVRLHHKYI